MLELDLQWRRGDCRLAVQARLAARATGLRGDSGAGKSTLLALIAGLQRPDRGRITLHGRPLVDTARGLWVPPEQRGIGLVFQDALLFPHLDVLGNLRYGHDALPAAARRFRLDDIIALLDLAPLLTRRPRTLSGGERQRVALGRALLASPALLLLDEPLAALDRTRRQQILPFLLRIRDTLDLPLIHVSHSQEELDYLCERMLTLADGCLTEDHPGDSA